MRLGKDLNDKMILSVTDGRLLGKVKDLYVDEELNEMVGINLGTEGMLRRKSILIPYEDVVVFGIDAILVKHSEVVTDDNTHDTAKEWLKLSKLRGRDVDTPGGTRLGSIGDILIDEQGHIAGFALSKVFVEGPLAERGMVLRKTVVDTGSEDGSMTIDLLKLEELYRAEDGVIRPSAETDDDATPDDPEDTPLDIAIDDEDSENDA